LKDIVLKLQSYTMDVNKVLLEERTTTLPTTNGLFTLDLQSFDDDNESTVIEEFDKSIKDAE